jgi:hypothetical protein
VKSMIDGIQKKEFYLSRSRILDYLGKISKTLGDNRVFTIYMPPGLTELDIISLLKTVHTTLPEKEIIELVQYSETGTMLFWGESCKCLIKPPMPFREKAIFPGCNIETLHKLLSTDFLIGLVLIHLGSYAIGVCRGEELISTAVGFGFIHGRQRQGGSSSKRYLRRRENQVTEFLDKVAYHVNEQMSQYSQNLNYLVYGGPRQTILQLKKKSPLLLRFENNLLPTIDVRHIRSSILETTIKRVWSSYVIEWC